MRISWTEPPPALTYIEEKPKRCFYYTLATLEEHLAVIWAVTHSNRWDFPPRVKPYHRFLLTDIRRNQRANGTTVLTYTLCGPVSDRLNGCNAHVFVSCMLIGKGLYCLGTFWLKGQPADSPRNKRMPSPSFFTTLKNNWPYIQK